MNILFKPRIPSPGEHGSRVSERTLNELVAPPAHDRYVVDTEGLREVTAVEIKVFPAGMYPLEARSTVTVQRAAAATVTAKTVEAPPAPPAEAPPIDQYAPVPRQTFVEGLERAAVDPVVEGEIIAHQTAAKRMAQQPPADRTDEIQRRIAAYDYNPAAEIAAFDQITAGISQEPADGVPQSEYTRLGEAGMGNPEVGTTVRMLEDFKAMPELEPAADSIPRIDAIRSDIDALYPIAGGGQ